MTNVPAPPKVQLCTLPTPLHRLERVSQDLNLDVWIKRDDLTGFAAGGNKGRKLEYLLPQILASGADTVVTCGATQSNFIRQLAAACAIANLQCHAVCMDLPHEPQEIQEGEAPSEPPLATDEGSQSQTLDIVIPTKVEGSEPIANDSRVQKNAPPPTGNLYLDPYFPVHRRHLPDGTWDELDRQRDLLAQELRDQGKKVYVVKLGGGSPEAVYAFHQAGLELLAQLPEPPQNIVVSTSSGSTHVGLAHAFRDTKINLYGISADPEPELPQDLAKLSQDYVAAFHQEPALNPQDFLYTTDYVGEGYALPSPAAEEALLYLAQKEGILLDPVYSAKAFAGLLDLARTGRISGTTVFWHTGGLPALFA